MVNIVHIIFGIKYSEGNLVYLYARTSSEKYISLFLGAGVTILMCPNVI